MSSYSQREIEVSRLVVEGFSNSDIARSLGISRNTVRCHLKKIYARIGQPSRAILVREFMLGHLEDLIREQQVPRQAKAR